MEEKTLIECGIIDGADDIDPLSDGSIKNIKKHCSCDLCELSDVILSVLPKCNPKQRAAIEEVWSRMEHAELDRDWTEAKAHDGEILRFGDRVYRPDPHAELCQTCKYDGVKKDVFPCCDCYVFERDNHWEKKKE